MVLADYASKYESRGRLFKEKRSKYCNEFQLDRDRVVYSAAFRKLEYKTQIFSSDFSDYVRTRMMHCVELSQVARSIGGSLGLNIDLIECIALASGMGQAPFGHAGSRGLNAATAKHGIAFDPGIQAVRIATKIEEKYLDFKGFNLTWESLSGLVSCNGPIAEGSLQLTDALGAYSEWNFATGKAGSAEAQVVNIANGIATVCHDIEDGFRGKVLSWEQLMEIPFFGVIIKQISGAYCHMNAKHDHLVFKAVNKMMARMVSDVVFETTNNVEKHAISTQEDVMDMKVIAMSEDMCDKIGGIRESLRQNMYAHHVLERISTVAHAVTSKLFDFYFHNPRCLPHEWQTKISLSCSDQEVALVICDFISGMTDRYATSEYRKYILGTVMV